jgi:hypothetical protein
MILRKNNRLSQSGISGLVLAGNVFRKGTVNFNIRTEKKGRFVIQVFDVRGRQVWYYKGETAGPEYRTVRWNYTSGPDELKGSGVYSVRFTTDIVQPAKRFVILPWIPGRRF